MRDRLFLLGKNAGNDLTVEDDMVIINDSKGKELLRVHNPELSEVLRGAFLDMSDENKKLKAELEELKKEKSFWWDYLTKVQRDTKGWLRYKRMREQEV